MTGIDSWSTSPATNATADGGSVNWAEGQAPSTVNNTARQQASDVRSAFNDLAWFQYGTGDQGAGNLAVPAVYASATSFTITGADVTTKFEATRRVRAVGSGTGTIYGSISSSSYNGGNTTTTVNVTWDSGSLSNETLVISLSQIPATGQPIPFIYKEGTWTPSIGGTATYTTQVGTYTKVGRMVFIRGQVTINAIGTGSATTISGLPFTSATSSNGGVLVHYFASINTSVTWLAGQIAANGTTISFNDTIAAQASAGGAASVFANSARVDFTGWYEATA